MKNLAADPAYGDKLERMRALLKRQMIEINDLGMIPESELEEMGLKLRQPVRRFYWPRRTKT